MSKSFLKYLEEEDNFTLTENGAISLKSTTNWCLDAFGMLGAMKDSSEDDILTIFYKAFAEDPETAMRLLFYIRDIRGGQGMRYVFRVILNDLALTHPDIVKANFDNILFFGRGDDYLSLFNTSLEDDMIQYCYEVLKEDAESIKKGGDCSLLAKWMPSENTSSETSKYYARKFISGMHITARQYRKLLSSLRAKINIVEAKMSANKWDEIDFSKLPSRASMIYSDAFFNHAQEEYTKYLSDVTEGKAKINANALFPVDIVKKAFDCQSNKDRVITDALWKALPDYFNGNEESGICVVDVSGSMWGTPLLVALSLGLYCADKAEGPYKNHFITFSSKPSLREIKGNCLADKLRSMSMADWGLNTNISAVFDLILKTALKNKLSPEALPSKLYIISDMQFDICVTSSEKYNDIANATLFEKIKEKYTKYGYTMPAIVFWDVRASKCGMYQMKDTDNCAIVSGYSPSLFKAVIEGTEWVEETKDGKEVTTQKLDPITVMRTALYNERYDRVIWNVN